MREAADPAIFTKYADRHELEENYQETCRLIHSVLGTKTKWADAVIAVRLDGMKVGDYAASIGLKDASIVSKWLMRAEKNSGNIVKSVRFPALLRLHTDDLCPENGQMGEKPIVKEKIICLICLFPMATAAVQGSGPTR